MWTAASRAWKGMLGEQWALFQVLDVYGWNQTILEERVPSNRPREEQSWLFPALNDHQRHIRYLAAMWSQ